MSQHPSRFKPLCFALGTGLAISLASVSISQADSFSSQTLAQGYQIADNHDNAPPPAAKGPDGVNGPAAKNPPMPPPAADPSKGPAPGPDADKQMNGQPGPDHQSVVPPVPDAKPGANDKAPPPVGAKPDDHKGHEGKCGHGSCG